MTGEPDATLRRGTRYLRSLPAQSLLAGPWPDGARGIARGRFVGNCLAELDRFLHLLMDDLAPGLGQVAMPDQRNAALKIGRVGGVHHGLAADQQRLRALGRSRACYARCQGIVRRADVEGGAWMTAGWPVPDTPVLRRYALGEALTATGADLADVARFYEDLADRLGTQGQMRRVPG